ncbi:amino acid ABC transporter substrate-binding protein [Achromobacter marplatensis]|jgi:general L-amino acid transport system substrate-binding protein|uniref:Amino acid ABC transporter substrate-binding protein n=1 Tax=Achromobacter marplatensis TaxID=470868 RepID=J4QXM6_9BURK|nr:amino acid ABC transporter substrate-binding protein [Achromobacter marplatensis]EJO33085.1 general L-amino acid-binding periplasmic protein AapJ 1 [Achromobacter marplatensis]MDH2052649.1 amino acid ABC transporter substrate-binding protein [Achromobacter marplatensis]OWT54286.1 amino acid ABC transporter substrate-binding protein [Achromobacter marplatensis]RBP09938.1 amino acid ABC transporter substrate-binding protein (PAAT family) [Achromobacter marplatensis]CAB3716281.1 Putative amino
MKRSILFAAGALALACASQAAVAGPTLDAVKKKGFVQCGLTDGVSGFSATNSKGEWEGMDVDICRAVAAAVFGDSTKFKGTALSTQQRFTALQSGEVDVLLRTVTLTQTRDTSLGLSAVAASFYDGQGILVNKKLGVKSAKELNGATVCVQPGTTTELNLADWFRSNKIEFKPVVIDKVTEVVRAFESGRCDAFTDDASQLAAVRATQVANPNDYEILPERFSKEPLGPMVRQGDENWLGIVRWTLFALLEAEEYGITQKNVDEMLKSSNPNVLRILGVTPGAGKNMGVDEKWAYNAIKAVGNYSEVFERNVGKDSKLGLQRGTNALWSNGGAMYPWPIR